MMTPTIHLNGTSRDELMRQLIDAREALRTAIYQLCEAYPNGRDYYVQGPDALPQAMKEHESRVARLQSVHDELGDLAESIS